MSYRKKLVFANFTCKFGDKFNLLDLFDNVVHPSFQSKNFSRPFKGTVYFFLDTKLLTLKNNVNGEDELVLAGRLVKNTKLKREQVYRSDEGIINDKRELESAPTSFFLLILSSHRLLYMKEVAGAPPLATFQSTCQNFLKRSHKSFIDREYDKNNAERSTNSTIKRITKKKLVLDYPYPILRITTLTDPTSLRSYVDQFEKIEELTIKILPTNDEDIDNDDFWNALGDCRERMGGKSYAETKFRNKADGLNQEEVYEQSSLASEHANSELKLKGKDSSGGNMRGNNDDFQLSVDISEDTKQKNIGLTAQVLFSKFLEQIRIENIVVPKSAQSVIQKLIAICNLLL